ncbi:unnamed protein product [Sphagnum jensenii]
MPPTRSRTSQLSTGSTGFHTSGRRTPYQSLVDLLRLELASAGYIEMLTLDVVLPIPDTELGASNARRLVALHAADTNGFEIIHGLVDRVMGSVQLCPDDRYASNSLTTEELASRKRITCPERVYSVEPSDDH